MPPTSSTQSQTINTFIYMPARCIYRYGYCKFYECVKHFLHQGIDQPCDSNFLTFNQHRDEVLLVTGTHTLRSHLTSLSGCLQHPDNIICDSRAPPLVHVYRQVTHRLCTHSQAPITVIPHQFIKQPITFTKPNRQCSFSVTGQ